MKTISLLSVTCEAISTVCRVITLLQTNHDDDDQKAAKLNADEHLALSGSMTVVRELMDAYPEQIITEDITARLGDFYQHLFCTDDLTDLMATSSAAHVLHTFAYDRYTTAREAINLYT